MQLNIKVGSQVDKIAVRLDHEKNGLINDNLSLEQLYQRNKISGIKYLYAAGGEDWRIAAKTDPWSDGKSARNGRPNGCASGEMTYINSWSSWKEKSWRN